MQDALLEAPPLSRGQSLIEQRIAELREYFTQVNRPFPNRFPADTEALRQAFDMQHRELLQGFSIRPDNISAAEWAARQKNAETFIANRFRQRLDPILQPHYGIEFFTWVSNSNNSCANCAAHDGNVYAWGSGEEPPGCEHCQCEAQPDFGPHEQPLDGVYPEILLLPLLRVPQLIRAWRAWALARNASRNWRLGNHKSAMKWRNRLEKGNWTPDKITRTIKNGRAHPAPNKPFFPNTATRYELDGDFIVI